MNSKIITFGLIVVLFFSATANIVFAGDWPMFRHNLQHTGATDETVPDELKLIWSYHTGSSGGGETPVISNNKVFGGSCRGIYCLDADTGDLIWDFVTENVDSSPAVYEGKVFVGSEGNKTFCLSADTGKLIWSYDMGGGKSTPAVYEGKVFAGSNDKNIYCLSAGTGELIWEYKTGGFVISSPAIYGGKVFVGSNDKKVYCLNADTGELIWCYRTQGIIHSSPAVSDDKVFVGSWDGRLYCLGADTGKLIWSYETRDRVVDSSPAVSNDKVFVGSDTKIYCINANIGELIWSYKTGNSYPVISEGKVFVMGNKLYCFGGKGQHTPTITNESESQLATDTSQICLSWSPDGKQIAYLERTESDGTESGCLWIMNADGTGGTQLATVGSDLGSILLKYGVDWSPDGKSIVFMEETPDRDGNYDIRSIWVMNIETKEKIKLASDAIAPSWSPDGTRIAYIGFSLDPEGWDLWVMDVDGGNKRMLAPDSVFPSWSPDGTKIAYSHKGINNVEEVWVVNVLMGLVIKR